MNWATTLIQFPHGLVATAISVAILPTLARQAVSAQQTAPFKDTLGLGLRLATVLILPAAVGLFVLATPIVALLFEHGQFNAADTAITVLALRVYLIGLPFAAIDLLLIYAFYARQDTLTPALIGLFSLTVYMVVALALMPRWGLYSLMAADSVKHIVHASVSMYLLWRRLGGFGKQYLSLTALKSGAAALLMGAVAWVILPPIVAFVGDVGTLREVAIVVLSGSVSVAVFAAVAFALRVEELRWIVGLLWSRVRR